MSDPVTPVATVGTYTCCCGVDLQYQINDPRLPARVYAADPADAWAYLFGTPPQHDVFVGSAEAAAHVGFAGHGDAGGGWYLARRPLAAADLWILGEFACTTLYRHGLTDLHIGALDAAYFARALGAERWDRERRRLEGALARATNRAGGVTLADVAHLLGLEGGPRK